MVEQITDPMSVSIDKTYFCESVENDMRKNRDLDSADLCRDIRAWWESEDVSGFSAADRISMRLPLRKRLLSKVNFERFPPIKQYVYGWPVQLWEALIANIDAKAYLYSLVHGGTYNVRAFSSMMGESFFSELALHDKRGQGSVTAKEFGEFIGYTTEKLHVRLDPGRNFAYCTSKAKVYDVVDESYISEHQNDTCKICIEGPCHIIRNITLKDHPFDRPERRRLPGRKKTDTISTTRNVLLKGQLGVRWENARCNMQKMLPTKRMGIPD